LNFLLDNNLPPSLALALHELCKAYGHSVVPLRGKFPENCTDVHWIDALSQEGGWAIVSQDRFLKGDLERSALKECGLVVFCLAKQWSQMSFWDKAHNLVLWWPAIIRQAVESTGGDALKVNWKFRQPGRFEHINLQQKKKYTPPIETMRGYRR
jgi:hypothetical protein